MKKIHRDRLLKLASHLESGKLGHDKFNFGVITLGPRKENGCGDEGCGIGECPVLFPRYWCFRPMAGMFVVRLKSKSRELGVLDAAQFFSLSNPEVSHLFQPCHQKPRFFGGKKLDRKATRLDVAANIRAFVAKKEQSA